MENIGATSGGRGRVRHHPPQEREDEGEGNEDYEGEEEKQVVICRLHNIDPRTRDVPHQIRNRESSVRNNRATTFARIRQLLREIGRHGLRRTDIPVQT